MATFNTLAKFLSLKNYYTTKIAGLGENLIAYHEKGITKINTKSYMYTYITLYKFFAMMAN